MRAVHGQTGGNRRTSPNEDEDLRVSGRNRHIDDAACRRRGHGRRGSAHRIEAARKLGMGRSTLYRQMEKLGIPTRKR